MDNELNRAETELLQEETILQGELGRLSAVSLDLEKRLKAIKFTAAEAAAKGVTDEELAARLEATAVPAVDTETPFAESRAARQAAVVAWRAATQATREQVAELRQTLSGLSTQILTDEKFVKRLASLARRAKEVEASVSPTPAATTIPSPIPKTAPKIPTIMDPRTERQSPRVKMQTVIDLHSDDNFFRGFSSNISDGGIFVATVNLLPIGTHVDLQFSLPSGHRVEAHGEVRWVREINDQLPDSFPGLGIQFSSLDSGAVDAINGFVSEREPLFFVD
jgi:uncharacterized protein (TIGR02266 family)